MDCPLCGQRASLVGLPNGNYPAAYRCCSGRHGEYNFGVADLDQCRRDAAELLSREECCASAALSKANARSD